MKDQQSFIILGGGTAGWMAANLLAKSFNSPAHLQQHSPVKVSLIEAPDIATVGVGEGSTPQLRSLFDYLEIPESLWMPKCNATYKAGISFKGWSDKKGFEDYFHPFPAKTDRDTAQAFVYNAYLRRHGYDVDAHPNHYFLPAFLAAQQRGPIPSDNFPFPVSYGYHFDSYLMGDVLRDNALALGVEHIQAKIEQVHQTDKGDISHLIDEQGQHYSADFFIDCSGFAGVLIEKALNVPFNSFANNLFNDSAVVIPTTAGSEPRPYTTATALKAGWAWDIPLINRTGNGYVYSSAYTDKDEAEHELRAHLDQLDSEVEARHLRMRVGQREQHWAKNCLAVGLSQGFIEPLEATALHLAQDTLQNFIESVINRRTSSADQVAFNKKIYARFEGVRDYIVCHYKMSSRNDTDYWRDSSANSDFSESLASVLNAWHTGEDLSIEIDRLKIGQYYSVISWHCLLAGYGQFPSIDVGLTGDPKTRQFPLSDTQDFNRRCALNFRDHRAQLNILNFH
jgi:2-polyprenyl-6-methoxyphenol hydroxylase-like FAD-dependent oxidoreductase